MCADKVLVVELLQNHRAKLEKSSPEIFSMMVNLESSVTLNDLSVEQLDNFLGDRNDPNNNPDQHPQQSASSYASKSTFRSVETLSNSADKSYSPGSFYFPAATGASDTNDAKHPHNDKVGGTFFSALGAPDSSFRSFMP